jgi:hypothetical protein
MVKLTAILLGVAATLLGGAQIAPASQAVASESVVFSCPGVSFSFAFAPRRGAAVTSDGQRLAVASLRGWTVSGSCTRVVAPKWGGRMAEPQDNLYRPITIRCRIRPPLRIYVSPARQGRSARRNILVTAGNPMNPVVGASFRNHTTAREPRSAFLYRDPSTCLGYHS